MGDRLFLKTKERGYDNTTFRGAVNTDAGYSTRPNSRLCQSKNRLLLTGDGFSL